MKTKWTLAAQKKEVNNFYLSLKGNVLYKADQQSLMDHKIAVIGYF